MKSNKKSLLAGVIVCLLLALTFQFIWDRPISNSFANSDTVAISNGNFNSSPTSYYLDSSPTGWSIIKSGTTATTGVINTNSNNFNNYLNTYQLSTNPETYYKDSSDTKILMINAKSNSFPNGALNQGYKSNNITLSPYSYYSFSVLVKAEVGAVGSIYIKGLEDTLKFENLSNTSWKQYKFYIETGSITETICFELWLGNDISQTSSKAIFFDNIEGNKLSKTRYNQEVQNNSFSQSYSISKTYISSFTNADFETGTTSGWTANSAFPMGTNHKVINTNDTNSMSGFSFLGGDNVFGNKALWLASKETPTSSFGYKSSTIFLPNFAVYKVSFNAKVDNNTTATAILKETTKINDILNEDDYAPKSASISITSNDSTNIVQNNYRNYSFYICGYSQYDTEFYIELWLGSETEAKSGSVLFDNFTIEQVTKTEYTNATADSYNVKLELKAETGSLTLPNGNFNLGYTENPEVTYPVIPSNWTTSQNGQQSGIINTNTQKFNSIKEQIGGLANPGNPEGFIGTDNEYNNILMLWNKTNSYQSITSDSVAVDKFDGATESFYKLSFNFKTLPSNSPAVNFNLQILDQDSNKIYELQNLNSTTWKNFDLYIKNGFYTTAIYVKFSFGTEYNTSSGYAFIDNVVLEKQSSMTIADWNNYKTNQTTFSKVADFKNGFLNSTSLQNGDEYELFGWTSELHSQQPDGELVAKSGLISTTNNRFEVICDSNNSNDKMMYIQTIANAEFSITSNFKAKLLANTKYKLSFFVKSILPTVDKDYKANYGLSLELVGTTGKLEHIKTNGEWKEYQIIVNVTNEAETNFKFTALTQNQTAGLFFVDNINITTLSDDDYKTIYDENQDNDQFAFVGSTDEEEDDEDTDTEQPTKGEFNWLIVPSLITAVALIIALVGFILRRINFKKYQKKIKTEYDRKKTLYRDVIRKQAQEMRDKEIQQYNIQNQELDTTIQQLEAEHKELLAKQRKEKGKKIDKDVEKSFKSYASKRTSLENKKEKIVEKIKYANSPDYLLELQKKINLDMMKKLKEENSKLAAASQTSTDNKTVEKTGEKENKPK